MEQTTYTVIKVILDWSFWALFPRETANVVLSYSRLRTSDFVPIYYLLSFHKTTRDLSINNVYLPIASPLEATEYWIMRH